MNKAHKLSGEKLGQLAGGRPGLVVMGGDSCSNGYEFESQCRVLNGHFSHIFDVKIVMLFV